MKRLLLGAAFFVLSFNAFAEGHYVPGVEGVNSATVPPPGRYYLGYLVNYDIESLKAPGSGSDIPVSNTGTVTALANRFVYITDKKVLGADYGVETLIPIISKNLDFNAISYDESDSGLGDIFLSPIVLGWHGEGWDAVFGAGFWLDNGDDDELANAGNGYTGIMLTGGGTWQLNEAKDMSLAVLARYEMNDKNSNDFEPGDQLTVEWGLGKQINPQLNLGLVGYLQRQMTDDKGTGASNDRFSRQAIGIEATYLSKSLGGFIKGAFYTEGSVEGGTGPGAEGDLLRLTLVKPF